MIFVGIDVGLSGALGIIDHNGEYITLYDMPIAEKHSKKKTKAFVKYQIDTGKLYNIMRDIKHGYNDLIVFVEVVNARPRQGVASTFSLGDSFGSVRAVCSALSLDGYSVAATVWKGYFDLSADKKASLEQARNYFPTAPLHLVKHHNRAESLLIAKYAHEQFLVDEDLEDF